MNFTFIKVKNTIRAKISSFQVRIQLAIYKLRARYSPKFAKRCVRQMRSMEISQALDSPEGRTALAQSMVEPIRRSLDYQGIGRNLLMVNELPQGAYASYERDPRSRVYARGVGSDRLPDGSHGLPYARQNSDRADALAAATYSFYAGDAYYSETRPAIPATAEDIRRVQEQLAQTANDPNLTIVTSSHGFDTGNTLMGYMWSPDIYISLPYRDIIEQETALCDYLVWRAEDKVQEKMAERRRQVRNSIMDIELGG